MPQGRACEGRTRAKQETEILVVRCSMIRMCRKHWTQVNAVQVRNSYVHHTDMPGCTVLQHRRLLHETVGWDDSLSPNGSDVCFFRRGNRSADHRDDW